MWKNEKNCLTKWIFRQINSLVIHLVKTLLSRNFCQNCVRLNCSKKIFREISFSYFFGQTVAFTKFLSKSKLIMHCIWLSSIHGTFAIKLVTAKSKKVSSNWRNNGLFLKFLCHSISRNMANQRRKKKSFFDAFSTFSSHSYYLWHRNFLTLPLWYFLPSSISNKGQIITNSFES